MFNVLYSLLTYGHAAGSSTYTKRSSRCLPDTSDLIVRDAILHGISGPDVHKFASMLCRACMDSTFSDDIRALDPENTYVEIGGVCWSLTGKRSDYSALNNILDPDIKNRITTNSWCDLPAAGCLQLLRRYNG